MSEAISGDTQVVLLLCSRLGQAESDAAVKLLTPKQYRTLAHWLQQRSIRPADLLSDEGRERLHELGAQREILERLLDRGAALGLMAERWTSRGLWVISRYDAGYPARYQTYFGDSAPALLFGAGNRELLHSGGLAVAGSREASAEDTEYARRLGSACAAQNVAVISGGARGIDLESMSACFEAGGSTIGVLPDSLGRSAVSARYREGLMSGRLLLLSPYEPEARWFAFAAMERNKLIYGLSDAALVVASSGENGGTWSGAMEALERGCIPVYVKVAGTIPEGNQKLLARGAKPFPEEPWPDLRLLFTPVDPQPALFSGICGPQTVVE